MDNNTQLPVEVTKDIAQKAEDFANSHINGRTQREIWDTVFAAYGSGATAYATKLQVLEYDNNQLKGELEGYKNAYEELQRQNEKMKGMATGWRPLLEKVLVMNEMWGDLPGEFINEVKKYLYGE